VRPVLVAFYGTLRDERLRRRLGVLAMLEPRGPCRIPGQLYDLGPYPALVTDFGGVALGELFAVLDPGALTILDAYEGVVHADPEGSEYVRRTLPLIEPRVPAWVYIYQGPLKGSYITSGDWLRRGVDGRPTG
jgi:gamma-glutamylcyclotransferase (GGCT)/AIG2-like uncharacterized protein YtfP